MKTLLLLGGMTPDVTILYYNIINAAARARHGHRTNFPLHIHSANLELMIQHASAGKWTDFSAVYADSVTALTRPKRIVDGVVICSILAHKVSRQLASVLEGTGVTVLHIADMLAGHIRTRYPQTKKLGLLGPKITMLDGDDPDFFVGRLRRHGFEVVVPEREEDIERVNRGMIEEVAKGREAVTEATRGMFVSQANGLVERGAEALVLGSTDLGFVLGEDDVDGIPVIEPAGVHASAAAEWAMVDD
ncbi:Asp/Glu/Hydantoin racemase domain-containing protein [Pochonia chlamydosporia 170]|uniref:Asp/Glu/Hydantoin racemase domain-containing protein n=1 Tax=Pochonia chlamydosporia 170 TaxID=1380566 RepID=A0A179F4F1_METCM|nr:Asp/Glu/Hydantoin racemase domain-containing protein [Pochonia chlamydosporia 170]OAQ60285.1 Asp/Glu/Hydantoin racemase domain-containing protein [Pochonia chlamydosporia 170]